jgi:hypothetical protein
MRGAARVRPGSRISPRFGSQIISLQHRVTKLDVLNDLQVWPAVASRLGKTARFKTINSAVSQSKLKKGAFNLPRVLRFESGEKRIWLGTLGNWGPSPPSRGAYPASGSFAKLALPEFWAQRVLGSTENAASGWPTPTKKPRFIAVLEQTNGSH